MVYSESDSIIELITTRQPHLIDDLSGYQGMSTRDGRFWDNVFPDVKGLPDTLMDIKIYYTWLNNIQALYQSYKFGEVSKKDFNRYYNAWGSDTSNCISSYVKTFVVVAAGTAPSGQRYYMFDSDNDFNMEDETLYETYIVERFGNNNKEFQPHKVVYEKNINSEIRQDSTWIAFYENKSGMWLQFCEKASTTFQFDTSKYSIDVRPSIGKRYRGGAKFNVSYSTNKRSKNYNVGEFIKLGESYYKFSCSSDGLKVFLSKDDNAIKNGSTQVGMPPIPFVTETINNDTINFPTDYKGKYVLLDFWALSCGPCIQEIRDYYIGIYEKYGGSHFEIIGIADDNIEPLKDFVNQHEIRWVIISDHEKDIQSAYNIIQYPTLFLIDPEGIIIAKDDDLRRGSFVSILDKHIPLDP